MMETNLLVLWENPQRVNAARKFELARTKLRFGMTRQIRSAFKKSAMPTPGQVAGKLLSSRARDDTPICPLFQMGQCDELGDCAKGVHRCAVILRSGRCCLFSHEAVNCRNKGSQVR